jgi:choline dehydrogenase-like flavoprotein
MMAGPVEMWAGPLQSARTLHFLASGAAADAYPGPAHGPFVIESAPPHPGLAGSAFPWAGRADSAAFMATLAHAAPLVALVADQGRTSQPLRSGRPHPVPHRARDARTARGPGGMARISRAAGALDRRRRHAGGWFGRTAGRTIERSAPEHLSTRSLAPNRTGLFSAHQMGSAPAGVDPVTSACDPWGRVRADTAGAVVPGLYVGDGSLFPTAIAVNPQVTIMALAERVARTVIAEG